MNITGKGRCNSDQQLPAGELLSHIPCNGKFLYSAFSQLNSQDTMAFFEEIGVPLKTERGNRVFPVSDRSFDVSGALEKRLRRLGVSVIRDRAAALLREGERVTGLAGSMTDYAAGAVILATGGLSYPLTGSTGDGYRLAESAGHTICYPPRLPGSAGGGGRLLRKAPGAEPEKRGPHRL